MIANINSQRGFYELIVLSVEEIVLQKISYTPRSHLVLIREIFPTQNIVYMV